MYCEMINCGYWYKNHDEEFPRCHCDLPEGFSPCEIEDNAEPEYDEND